MRHDVSNSISQDEYNEIVYSIVFWLMYDFRFKTEKTKRILKNLKKEYPEGFINYFKKEALKKIPSEFYKIYGIEPFLIR